MNAASNSCHYFRSSFAAIPCCLYSTAWWKKSFVAFVLEQVRKSLFHIWIKRSFEDLWKISLSVTPEGQSPVRGHFPQTHKAIQARELNVGFKSSEWSGYWAAQKRAFCSSPIAGHVSFCTNKYSVIKKKDAVLLQHRCNDAQLSFSEYKNVHKTKWLQNQEVWEGCQPQVLWFWYAYSGFRHHLYGGFMFAKFCLLTGWIGFWEKNAKTGST